MIALGLDLGLSCGWAVVDADRIIASGTWDLRERRFSGGGMAMLRFRVNLLAVLTECEVDHIAYEEVRQHKGTDAAHWYGGLYNTLLSVVESLEHPIPTEAYPVGAIKKFATGKGNASKDAMLAALVRRDGSTVRTATATEDEVDAIWIASYALDIVKINVNSVRKCE